MSGYWNGFELDLVKPSIFRRLSLYASFLRESWYYCSFDLGRQSVKGSLDLPLFDQVRFDRVRYRAFGYLYPEDPEVFDYKFYYVTNAGKTLGLHASDCPMAYLNEIARATCQRRSLPLTRRCVELDLHDLLIRCTYENSNEDIIDLNLTGHELMSLDY